MTAPAWGNLPICDRCWSIANPLRDPVRVRFEPPPVETCCMCGAATSSCIYVRVNRREVPFPGPSSD